MNCAIHSAQCIQCTVYSVQCTLYSVQYTVDSEQCTLHTAYMPSVVCNKPLVITVGSVGSAQNSKAHIILFVIALLHKLEYMDQSTNKSILMVYL